MDSALALDAGELGVIRLSSADVQSILNRDELPLLDLAVGSEKAVWPRVTGLFSRDQVKTICRDLEIRRPRVARESSLSGTGEDFWSEVEILSGQARDGSPVDFKMTFRGTPDSGDREFKMTLFSGYALLVVEPGESPSAALVLVGGKP